MFTIVLMSLIIMLLVSIVFMPKNKGEVHAIKHINDVDFASGVRGIARLARVVEHGSGVGVRQLHYVLQASHRAIGKKLISKKAITQGERWYYENSYHLKRFINNFNERKFALLPYVNGEIRVLTFARFIVENSKEGLNYARIKLAVDTYNRESQLTLQEIVALPDAIKFVLAEHIFILAKRFKNADKMKKCGTKGIVNRDLFESDIYLHFALQSKSKEHIKKELLDMGIDFSSININYAMSVAETTRYAEFLFASFREISNILPANKLIPLLIIDRQLVADVSEYSNMSFDTKYLYLTRIAELAEKLNASELLVTTKLIKMAEYSGRDVGEILVDYSKSLKKYVLYNKNLHRIPLKKYGKLEFLYIFAEVFATACVCGGLFVLTRQTWLVVLSCLPIFMIVDSIINTILSHNLKPRPLFSMNYDAIPKELNTMVVISEYIANKEGMSDAIKHMKTVQAVNKDSNIMVALLVDLPPASAVTAVEDAPIITLAKSIEQEQNMVVYIRKRKVVNGKFVAYERKRGAIMALVRHIVTGSMEDFQYISSNIHQSPKFILTLDADNVTNVNGVKDAINIISHPANKNYDLIAIRAKTNSYSLKTGYSSYVSQDSGLELYPNYSGLYHTMFKKDIFCGKGIFRVREFYNKLTGVLPDNRVLSHDILEGAILQTTSASVVYEDAPANFVADMERTRRWERGDLQLLPFVARSWYGVDGVKYRSEMGLFYKYIIIKNVVGIILPILQFALVLWGLIAGGVMLYAFLGLMLMPFLTNCCSAYVRKIKEKERFRYFVKRICNCAMRAMFNALMLPYFAVNSIRIIAETVIKRIKNGNMLQWKTYSMSQKDSGKFINEVGLSLIVLPITALVLLVMGTIPYLLLLYFALQVLCCYALFLSGKPLFVRELSASQRQKLQEYAESTYQYFKYMRTENGIIADNLQLKPYKGQSSYTSPTNIGFQFVAEIIALKMNLVSQKEFIENVSSVINSIEKMEKWQGNLYNWYDIATLKPTQLYVSSVDSGNLLACLILLKQALLELDKVGIAKKIDNLINNTNLSALFDKENGLFYLGYDGVEEKLCGKYDLLASESRLMSLVYIALTGDNSHWYALGRDITSKNGNTLLSWSGTMFEYIMPELFLKAPKKSLLGKSVRNAVKLQSKNRVQGLFGRSESGHYAFDSALSYQYKAFGCKCLALSEEEQKDVISPYSSGMGLMYNMQKYLNNMQKMEELAYKEYGFVEALDLEGRARVVTQFMTHHQGMMLASLYDVLSDSGLSKLMLQSPMMSGVSVLLTEGEICTKTIKNRQNISNKAEKVELKYYGNIEKLDYSMCGAGLSEAGLTAFYDPYGGGYLKYKNVIINRFVRGLCEDKCKHFYVIDNQIKSPTYITAGGDISKYGFVYCDKFIEYYNKADGVKLESRVDDNFVAEVQKLTVRHASGKRVGYYMPLALAPYDAQNAHPAFNSMFIVTECLSESNAIIATRNIKEGEEPLFVGMVVRGLLNVELESNMRNVIGREGAPKEPIAMLNSHKNEISFGEVLSPCFAFCGDMLGDTVEVVTIVAPTREELVSKINKLPKNYMSFVSEVGQTTPITELANKLLHPLINVPYSNEQLSALYCGGREEVVRFLDITHGKKLILFKYDGESSLQALEELCNALQEVLLFCDNFRLVVCDRLGYDKSSISSILASHSLQDYDVFCGEKATKGVWRYAVMVLNEKLMVQNERKIVKWSKQSFKIQGNGDVDLRYDYALGAGGFVGDSFVMPLNQTTGLPYSNVICGKLGGFIATAHGGGMQYVANSHERKVVRCDNEPIEDAVYEHIVLVEEGLNYRINGGKGGANTVLFDDGIVEFSSKTTRCATIVREYCVADGSVKMCEIVVKNPKMVDLLFRYDVALSLSNEINVPFVFSCIDENGVVKAVNLLNGMSVGVAVFGDISATEFLCDNCVVNCSGVVAQQAESRIYVAIGDYDAVRKLDYSKNATKQQIMSKMLLEYSNIILKSEDIPLDILFNKWALCQILHSRLHGRCGYYQQGGAIGFRDQLQDVMALLPHNPNLVKEHISLCCRHQYEEGDVMHWWHPPQFGLRTRITDDKLFLVQAVCEYIEATGDIAFLEQKEPFLRSNPLADGELSRYECPETTPQAETVHEHCKRALKNALKFGEHGLLIMGTGDWNDGMDAIGKLGKGESVMVSMMFVMASENFVKICNKSIKNELIVRAEAIRKALNDFAYDGTHYMRLYGDDGKWYGGKDCKDLQIDLISQAFAVFANIGDEVRLVSALKSAYSLVDRENSVIKLLYPPLDKASYLGYISAYPKGVRENGGQYTHASMWYILALLKLGYAEDAYNLLNMINPITRCKDKQGSEKYMGEPFVWSGDVYSGQYAGRCGWSWYTGSASWFYRVVLQGIFGVQQKGQTLCINPQLPVALNGAVLKYKNLTITYKIGKIAGVYVDKSKKNHISSIQIDNNPHNVDVICKQCQKSIVD